MDGECGVVRGWPWMGGVVWFVDGGPPSGVDGECVCVHGWGYMGNEEWTYWTNREWRKPQTKTSMNTY